MAKIRLEWQKTKPLQRFAFKTVTPSGLYTKLHGFYTQNEFRQIWRTEERKWKETIKKSDLTYQWCLIMIKQSKLLCTTVNIYYTLTVLRLIVTAAVSLSSGWVLNHHFITFFSFFNQNEKHRQQHSEWRAVENPGSTLSWQTMRTVWSKLRPSRSQSLTLLLTLLWPRHVFFFILGHQESCSVLRLIRH